MQGGTFHCYAVEGTAKTCKMEPFHRVRGKVAAAGRSRAARNALLPNQQDFFMTVPNDTAPQLCRRHTHYSPAAAGESEPKFGE